MKQHRFVIVAVLSLLAACTNYQEADVPDALRVDVTELSFSSGSTTRSVTVQSGTKWMVNHKPDWVSVPSISYMGGFQWGITFAVSENPEYDREGVISINSGSGSATIAVSQQGKKGKYVAVESVSVSPATLTMTEGETEKLSAVVTPSNASVKTVTWKSLNTAAATVDEDGNVTAVAEGMVTIRVTTDDGSKTADCVVTVKAKTVPVTGVSLDQTTMTLTEGDTSTLTATVAPANATNKDVTWSSSNTNVATVSTSGVVTAKAAGSATITVTTIDGSKKATCSVTVNAKVISVTGVSLDKTSLTLEPGQTETLTATVAPANATNKNVSWSSSNSSVATVSTSGVVTAKAVGSAKITVATVDGSKRATCLVTVKASVVHVTGVSLNKVSLDLEEGETYTLTATVTPSNATDKSVTWVSNNTDVATVSSSGVVTAVAAGTAAITVKTNDEAKIATCVVIVSKKVIAVTGVTLNYTSLTLTEGDTSTLTATVSPANATNKSVTWSSSNTAVATVSSSGVVTAKKAGSATITVTTVDGNKKATCSVTVQAAVVPVTGITLDHTSLSMTEGDTQTLVATVAPSNATNKNVTWTSNNTTVATVSSSGVVTAKKAGSATITVTTSDGGKKATCVVTVSAAVIPVTNVSLDPTDLTMGVGETYTLVATIYPSNATDLTIYWSSSDTSIATVSYSGVVTAHAAGSATITFSAGGKTATCTITVINRIYNVPISSYISNYWNSDKSATYCNVKVPFYVGDDDPAHCVFANDLNAFFETWRINSEGVPGILKLDPSITKIKYFFCSTNGHAISAPRINGKTVRFTIKSDGQELWANNGGSDQLIATIINDENADVPNIITLNKASTLAGDLLNTKQLYVNIGAVGLTDVDGSVTITFNGQDHFRADFVRPINISDIAADKFIDGVSYGEKGSYICVEDLFSISDWRLELDSNKWTDGAYGRNRQFSNYPNYWGFYGPFVVNIDLGNVKCDLGGSIDTIPSYLELTLVTYDEMAYIVTDPVEFRKLKATQFGYITYKNNGQVSNNSFNLYLNMTVDYGWGTIAVSGVRVPVLGNE